MNDDRSENTRANERTNNIRRACVCQRVKSVAFSVSQQFDRMSGMFADYSGNVMLGCVLCIVFLTMSIQTYQQLSECTTAKLYEKVCI